jgi:hypothetical protein
MTKVMFCSCKHEYQDEKYGPHMRLYNEKKSKNPGTKEWRCTVCGAIKN